MAISQSITLQSSLVKVSITVLLNWLPVILESVPIATVTLSFLVFSFSQIWNALAIFLTSSTVRLTSLESFSYAIPLISVPFAVYIGLP